MQWEFSLAKEGGVVGLEHELLLRDIEEVDGWGW